MSLATNNARPGSPPVAPALTTGDRVALAVTIGFPTLATWVYFVLLSGQAWMGPVYGVSKVLQVAFPLVWVLWVAKEQVRWRQARPRGLFLGLFSGLVMAGVILGAYYGILRGTAVLAGTPERLAEKIVGLRIGTPLTYFLMAFFLSIIHSGLEEYYWRWFVFGRLKRGMGIVAAVVIASLGFMAHHVIVLDSFLPGEYFWTATVLFSLSIAVGGAVWAWLYQKTGSLYAGWLSHGLADIAIMICGYDLAFPGGVFIGG